MKISVLTNNSCPNSRAFNYPLLAVRRHLSDNDYDLKFYFKLSKNEKIFDADFLFVNSNVFRPYWRSKKDEIFKLLESAKKKGLKIFWFDTTDSTWCTQFEVLPYVNLFLKNQVLEDLEKYLTPFRTGRIYTDYFDKIYKSGEDELHYPLPGKKDLSKMKISWNTCFENYTEKRFGYPARFKQRLRSFTYKILHEKVDIRFTPPTAPKDIDVSCRIGLAHSRHSVVAHRRAIAEILRWKNINCGKIPLGKYFRELRNSKIAVSPFGVGEITLRDFEIIICGAALIKPDMNHMKTWPDFFVPYQTFVPHKWDLSDLSEKIDMLLDDSDFRLNLAAHAQNVYRKAVSAEGLNIFAKRILDYLK